MLCAKNLKVALAAILGVVGLMGAGTAHAVIKLVPTGSDAMVSAAGHNPMYFAAEALAGASTATSTLVMVSATSSGFNVDVPEISAALEGDVAAGVARRYYVRFDLLEGNGFTGTNSTVRDRDTGDRDPQIAIGFDTAALSTALPMLSDENDAGSTPLQAPAATYIDFLGRAEAVIYSIHVSADNNIARGDGSLVWNLPDDAIRVGLDDPTSERTYYLRMSIWNDRDSATRADFTSLGSQEALWVGANTIALTKRTLWTEVEDDRTITATVESDFRSFRPENDNPAGSTGATTADKGKLATATVRFRDTSFLGAVGHVIRHHDDGAQIVLSDVLTSVAVSVEGNVEFASYDFGDFYLYPRTAADAAACEGGAAGGLMMRNPPARAAVGSTAAVPAATATTTTSVSRALLAAAIQPELRNVLADGDDTGVDRARFVFCANVAANTDDQQPVRFNRINRVVYQMTMAPNLVGRFSMGSAAHGAAGDSGEIDRDGTEVRIAYLTTAMLFANNGGVGTWANWTGGSYNQRLVIVNHGSSEVRYTLGQFAPEKDVCNLVANNEEMPRDRTCEGFRAVDRTVVVKPGASLEGMLEPGSSRVIPISSMIQIMAGTTPVDGRTSAILTLVGAPNDISVATTQVTLPEGQTDTVRYHPLTER